MGGGGGEQITTKGPESSLTYKLTKRKSIACLLKKAKCPDLLELWFQNKGAIAKTAPSAGLDPGALRSNGPDLSEEVRLLSRQVFP